MAVYAIGDLQGCYADLQKLLKLIEFNRNKDQLWFCGDLVNRGPDSLGCLRFVYELGDAAITVLGNHDLSLLATAAGQRELNSKDTLHEILNAKDKEQLLHWLRHRPLMHYDQDIGYAMVHAGLPREWTLQDALKHAKEVETQLQNKQYKKLLAGMYGNTPSQWSDKLSGIDRHRFIINCLTRMRYCTEDGALDLDAKGAPENQPEELVPWFKLRKRKNKGTRIVFGHWSTLGCTQKKNAFSLDTGCVWGGQLTAMQLDKKQPRYFSIECKAKLSQQ